MNAVVVCPYFIGSYVTTALAHTPPIASSNFQEKHSKELKIVAGSTKKLWYI